MGGRGASSGGVAGGGMNPANITGTTSLISAREGKSSEVDMTLAVLRDVQDQYNEDVNQEEQDQREKDNQELRDVINNEK